MGLEANCQLTTEDGTFAVKALLESDALILRGGYKQTVPRGQMANPHALGDQLLFEYGGRAYTLTLPVGQAAKWLKKLTDAPPSLAAKLGIAEGRTVLVYGHINDAALDEALHNAVTTDPIAATQGVIIAATPDDLSSALAAATVALSHAPLWIVYPKGAKSPLPESAVRSHMRALDYVDTKTSAVSATLTALRFSHRKA